jgi:hypothetical protein
MAPVPAVQTFRNCFSGRRGGVQLPWFSAGCGTVMAKDSAVYTAALHKDHDTSCGVNIPMIGAR